MEDGKTVGAAESGDDDNESEGEVEDVNGEAE